MVRALLDGRKTQTRRAIKHRILEHLPIVHLVDRDAFAACSPHPLSRDPTPGVFYFERVGGDVIGLRCPYGMVGDRLWARETWHEATEFLSEATGPKDVRYAASVSEAEWATTKWRSSIHMPRWASRITLRITDVRAERLQQISEADAITEGVERDEHGWKLYVPGLTGVIECKDARTSYRTLWNSINGIGSWEKDPWVWVLGFERVAE